MCKDSRNMFLFKQKSGGIMVRNLTANARASGDLGSVPGLGRPPGEMKWQSILVSWSVKLCGQEPGRLQSMGSQRVRHN